MPTVPINPYFHGLTKQEAIQRLEQRRSQILSEFGDRALNVVATWRGNLLDFSFNTTDGRKIIGTFTVEDELLELHVDVDPLRFLERPFAPGIVQNAIIPWLDTIFKS